MLKKDKTTLLLSAGTAVLLVAGGVGAYWLITSQTSAKNLPPGVSVIPQDAMMTLSLTTDAGQWNQLRKYGTPESKVAFDRLLQDLRDRFLTANGYGYEQDIQPWVGSNVTIAFLRSPNAPPPATGSSPLTVVPQQSVAIVLPIADPLKAKELLGQPKPLKQGKMVSREYKGVQVTEAQGDGRNFSVAVLGTDYLVITDNPKATDRTIDTYKGEASLANTPGLGDAVEQIKTNQPFAQAFVNIPVAAAYTSLNSARPISQQNLEKLQTQGFASTMTLEGEGIGFKSISWLKPDSQKRLAVENKAQKMVNRLPSNTLMMISGGNLQRLWQDYVLGADANPVAPFQPQALRTGLKATTGLDWDRDFVTWMGGEFSLALIPTSGTQAASQQGAGRFGAGFVLMVEANNRKAADKSLKQLDEAMKTKKFKVEDSQVSGQSVTKWTSPYGGLTVTRGWMEGNVAFLAVGGPVVDTLLPTAKSPLVGGELFQKTVRSELKQNNGQFFLDVNSAFNPKNLALPELPPSQKVWVDAIQSIGITTAVVNDRTTRYDSFVRLKSGTPSPSPSPIR